MKMLIAMLFLASTVSAQNAVQLRWDPVSVIPDGYNVYRTEQSGVYPLTPINPSPVATALYADDSVLPGRTYFYTVTTKIGTEESVKSNEVSANVPPAIELSIVFTSPVGTEFVGNSPIQISLLAENAARIELYIDNQIRATARDTRTLSYKWTGNKRGTHILKGIVYGPIAGTPSVATTKTVTVR